MFYKPLVIFACAIGAFDFLTGIGVVRSLCNADAEGVRKNIISTVALIVLLCLTIGLIIVVKE